MSHDENLKTARFTRKRMKRFPEGCEIVGMTRAPGLSGSLVFAAGGYDCKQIANLRSPKQSVRLFLLSDKPCKVIRCLMLETRDDVRVRVDGDADLRVP